MKEGEVDNPNMAFKGRKKKAEKGGKRGNVPKLIETNYLGRSQSQEEKKKQTRKEKKKKAKEIGFEYDFDDMG